MNTTSLADAKNRLSEIITAAEKTHERTVITKNGRPAAVLLAAEDFEGLEATLEILSDPEEAQALREAIAEANAAPDLYWTEADVRQQIERRQAGNPMTEAEIDAQVIARIGPEAFARAQQAAARAVAATRRSRGAEDTSTP